MHIYSYGLMVALAFWLSVFLLSKHSGRIGKDKDFFWSLSLRMLLGGILGGRLLYALLNLELFLSRPWELFALWHGGLVWYGAFLGGFLSGIHYLRSKKAKIAQTLDLVAPFAALGHSIGRIGCLLNGCCYGRPSRWGIYSSAHNDYLLPAQLISSLNLLAIFVVLRLLQEKNPKTGRVFLLYLIFSSFERFMVEFIRGDSTAVFHGLTIFQLISAVTFLSGAIVWLIISLSRKKSREGA